jgi:hypothetical protein
MIAAAGQRSEPGAPSASAVSYRQTRSTMPAMAPKTMRILRWSSDMRRWCPSNAIGVYLWRERCPLQAAVRRSTQDGWGHAIQTRCAKVATAWVSSPRRARGGTKIDADRVLLGASTSVRFAALPFIVRCEERRDCQFGNQHNDHDDQGDRSNRGPAFHKCLAISPTPGFPALHNHAAGERSEPAATDHVMPADEGFRAWSTACRERSAAAMR